MKVIRVSALQAELPYVGGEYRWGRGEILSIALSTVIVVETDAGLAGYGECCPIGSNYLAAYPEGIVPALARVAPAVVGLDPREVHSVERAMDRALKGHPYVKAAIDAACWDILGKACSLPVYTLLGGKLTDGAPVYRVVTQKPVREVLADIQGFRERGYRQFQIKVGADYQRDIDTILAVADMLEPGENAYADANTGWTVNEAVKVCHAVRDTSMMIKQPCPTYEECLHVRQRSQLPSKLDECVTDIKVAERIVQDQAAEVVCLKLSNLGGLTKARRVRDYFVDHGISVVAEDTWGGEISSAAVAHFAASTPQDLLYNTTDLHNYVDGSTGTPAPRAEGGRLYASDMPGLGVEPNYDALSRVLVAYT